MRIKIHVFLLVYILVILAVLVITLFPSSVLRVILGLPLVLFLPGGALVLAVFPGKDILDGMERTALSLALSVAVSALIAFALNFSPWGIKLYSVIVSDAVFIVALTSVAWLRQGRLPREDRLAISFHLSLAGWRQQGAFYKILSGVLALVIIGVIATSAYVIASPARGETYTEFYILGTDGRMADYPVALGVGEEGVVTVRIVNHERQATSYRVEVMINGIANNEVGPITLEDNEKYEDFIAFTPDRAGNGQKVDFILYREGSNEAYRWAELILNVAE